MDPLRLTGGDERVRERQHSGRFPLSARRKPPDQGRDRPQLGGQVAEAGRELSRRASPHDLRKALLELLDRDTSGKHLCAQASDRRLALRIGRADIPITLAFNHRRIIKAQARSGRT